MSAAVAVDAPSEAREALVRLTQIVSDRFGIVSELALPEPGPGDPSIPVAVSRPARAEPLGWGPALHEGSGAALERERAIVKALAETVERYCASYQPRGLRFGSYRDCPGPALPPAEFAIHSAEQYETPGFPISPFGPGTPVQWVEGSRLADGERCWVPAPFVYLPYRRLPDEPRVWTPISTGLAAATGRDRALSSALREVVERDAFTLVWRHRVRTPELELDALEAPERELLEILRLAGMRCRCRLLTQDIEIPVVLAVAEPDDGEPPHCVLGAGTHGDVRTALRLALEETCLSLYGMNRMLAEREQRKEGAGEDGDGLATLAEQSQAYALDPRLKAAAPFLFGRAARSVSLAELDERFAATRDDSPGALVDALAEWGRDAAAVDCTTCDVADIGFRVVRVVVPPLRPLDHNHALPHLGGRRRLPGDVNLAPHPFP